MAFPHHLRMALYAERESVGWAFNSLNDVVFRFSRYNKTFPDIPHSLVVEGIDTGSWAAENLKQAAIGQDVDRMGRIPTCATLRVTQSWLRHLSGNILVDCAACRNVQHLDATTNGENEANPDLMLFE